MVADPVVRWLHSNHIDYRCGGYSERIGVDMNIRSAPPSLHGDSEQVN